MNKGADRHSALRTVRGPMLAVASAALAITAHLLADGELPDLALTLLLTTLIGWISTALTERVHGVPGVLALLGGGQLLMHLVLGDLATHGHAAAASNGIEMTLAHAAATLVTAVLVAHAETVLLAVAATVLLAFPQVRKPAAVPAGPVAPVAAPYRLRAFDVHWRRICGRRGPPVCS